MNGLLKHASRAPTTTNYPYDHNPAVRSLLVTGIMCRDFDTQHEIRLINLIVERIGKLSKIVYFT